MDPKNHQEILLVFFLPLPYLFVDEQNASGCVCDLGSIRSNLSSHSAKKKPARGGEVTKQLCGRPHVGAMTSARLSTQTPLFEAHSRRASASRPV